MTPLIENFISKLALNLTSLSTSEQKSTLDFYRDFLLDGDFQTKEEIVRELGTPDDLAKEIKQDYVKFLTAVTASANDPNASDNYFNGLRVKRYPRRKRTITLENFNQVKLAVHSTDVVIYQGSQFQITVADYSSRPIEVDLVKQTLVVKEVPVEQKNSVIMFNRLTNASRVEITVPKIDSLTKISGHNHNGDIMLQNLRLKSIVLNLHNGDIYINNVSVSDEFIFSSKNADCFVTQSKIAQLSSKVQNGDGSFKRSILKQIIAQTDDGDIEINQCHANISLQAQNGDILIRKSQLTDQNIVKSTNGDLKLSQLAHDISVQLKANEGDIIYRNSSIGSSFNSQSMQSDSLKATLRDGDIIIK
ncbi:DUF4097 family beta strand repeat-containing protein [Lactobacillus juensis]|uniref:DUF4097 family beta strand repeat-containing protein n=1 Tax=Lactobacillus juensis TaxID=3082862 RepID=UPI0030C6D5CE